jgi:hypothetical protein
VTTDGGGALPEAVIGASACATAGTEDAGAGFEPVAAVVDGAVGDRAVFAFCSAIRAVGRETAADLTVCAGFGFVGSVSVFDAG